MFLEHRYRVGARLGGGGMGDVYEGLDVRLDRPVAIKWLARRHLAEPTARARFEQEARALAQLEHPAIVAVLSIGEHEGRPYFVMPLLDGETLLARSPLAVEDAVRAGLELCEALAHVHARGLVHRDVKPSNVFCRAAGGVVLLDFGILRDTAGEATEERHSAGTAEYMAPEQAVDARRADARSDLYALGATLFHALSGKPPFVGESSVDVLVAHRISEAPRVGRLVEGVPPALDRLIASFLAKTPAARPADALTARDAFAALLRHPRGRRRGGEGSTRVRIGVAAAALLLVASALGVAAGWLLRDESEPAMNGGRGVTPALIPTLRSTAAEMPRPTRGDHQEPERLLRVANAAVAVKAPPSDAHAEETTAPMPSGARRPAKRSPLAARAARAKNPVPAAPTAATLAAPAPTTAHVTTNAPAAPERASNTETPIRIVVLEGGQSTWANVELDRETLGQSMVVERRLTPGPHLLEVRREARETVRRTFIVRAGEPRTLEINLKRTLARQDEGTTTP